MKLPRLYLPGCPHRPTPRQWLALSLLHSREVLYGGAAGGGKSDYLLMSALQFIDVPGYSAVIFRRTFPQLAAPEDGLLARAQKWLHGQPGFVGSETVGGFPTRWKYRGGGTLSFAHMQLEKDKYSHQGPSYAFIGWDELTQFSEGQYRYLLSRSRRPSDAGSVLSRVPLRVRATSNPGGEGHAWVAGRFPVPGNAEPREGCRFVPSKLRDNPHIDADSYVATLQELHPYERAQLLEGDWQVRPPGARFERHWFRVVEQAPECRRWVRFWDLAATEPKKGRDPDWSVGAKMGVRSESPQFVVADVARFRCRPGGLERRIRHVAEADGRGVTIAIEQEPGSSGKIAAHHWTQALAGFHVVHVPSTGSKVVRSNPWASQAEAGNVAVVKAPWIDSYFTEHEMFTGVDGQGHDDQVDASSGALGILTGKGTPADAIKAMEQALDAEA